MNIAVFGLGKLGSVIAAVYAEAGHRVVGVDVNESLVRQISEGNCPYQEPGLAELMELGRDNLSATTETELAVANSDVAIVIVPTPSSEDGSFSNRFVVQAAREIGDCLVDRNHYVVVLASTVSPGSCESEIRNALEEASGKVVGEEIGLVYSPEFIALGSIVRDMKNPEMVLLGSSDRRSSQIVQGLISSVVKSDPKYFEMSLTSAEIAKLAVNTFVTTKISFANMIGELCGRLHGASSTDVLNAIGADGRIGSRYLKSALGYGGPCFPRDNRALQAFAVSVGTSAPLATATDEINDRQVSRLVREVEDQIGERRSVAVLGMSYKSDTPVCEESQGIMIANQLCDRGYKVRVHDPLALDNARSLLRGEIEVNSELTSAIDQVDVIVIATPWSVYAGIGNLISPGTIVIDPWHTIQAKNQHLLNR